ncbi:MAG: hypothetical protein MJZ13_08930 [Bacteroidales bacterium]|nr:hypothetical protein [Bacteroidales bacterium]
MSELDVWWSSLKITEKERIATKAVRNDGKVDAVVVYPECTRWWISIPEERKQAIHAHCTDVHGLLLPEWKEGKCLSY